MPTAATIVGQLCTDDPLARHQLLRDLVERIILSQETIRIELRASTLAGSDATIVLEEPMQLRQRGVERKIVVPSSQPPRHDKTLIDVVVQARHWFGLITTGKATSIRQLAQANDRSENDISRFLPLAFLAPDIVEAILAGTQPPELTADKLKRLSSLPQSWQDQRQLLGFTSKT